jgi:enoyl-CoA hydratase/carnithine racemase
MANVSVKVHASGGTIVMDQAATGNALSRSMVQGLEQAIDDLHQEKRVRYVILTASGRHFSTGMDLRELHQVRSQETAESLLTLHQDWSLLAELLQKILRFPKPIIAAVDGDAVGAGLALGLACDLIVATERSRFSAPAQNVGLISGLVAPLATFRLGGALAARLLLTGDFIAAAEAHHWGMIARLCTSDQIWVTADALGNSCARGPAEAVQMTKRLLNESIGEALHMQLTIGAGMGATACTTESAAEGMRAFVEKRLPVWP